MEKIHQLEEDNYQLIKTKERIKLERQQKHQEITALEKYI